LFQQKYCKSKKNLFFEIKKNFFFLALLP